MDYRPPAFKQPRQFGGSFDSIFEQYVAAKQQQEQQGRQDFSDTVQYGTPLRGLTPEQLNRAAQGPTVTPAQPAVAPSPAGSFVGQMAQPYGGQVMGQSVQDPRLGVSNLMASPNPGSEAVPGQEQFDNDPHVAAIQRFIQGKKKQTQIDQEATQAGTLEKTAHARKDIADANLADRKPFDFEHSENRDQFVAKRLTALGDALDESKGRNGALGVSKLAFDRAEKLQSLANATAGNPDKRQMEELAIGLNAMLSGSNTGSQDQVKALLPSSLVGDANKLREWLTNDPTGLDQQKFVKRLNDTIAREKETASQQMKRTKFARVAQFHDAKKLDPDGFKSVLYSHDVDPEEYDKYAAGGYKSQSAVQGSGGGEVQTRTLKDGTTVKVKPNGRGGWDEVL